MPDILQDHLRRLKFFSTRVAKSQKTIKLKFSMTSLPVYWRLNLKVRTRTLHWRSIIILLICTTSLCRPAFGLQSFIRLSGLENIVKNKTKQNKTKQNKTKQNKTKQKTKQKTKNKKQKTKNKTKNKKQNKKKCSKKRTYYWITWRTIIDFTVSMQWNIVKKNSSLSP